MHNNRVSGGRFLAVTILNVAITIVEIIGGSYPGASPYFPTPFITLVTHFQLCWATLPNQFPDDRKTTGAPMVTGGRKF